MTEPISDAALDARLAAHFEALAKDHVAPDFDSQMQLAAARLRSQPPRLRWRVGAYATAATVAGAILVWSLHEQPMVLDAADQRLVTELTASTSWHAPSDDWLAIKGLEILTVPRFDEMRYDGMTGNSAHGRSAAGGV